MDKTGGPAFPKQTYEYDGANNVLQYQDGGMTLLDYFAGQALKGMMAAEPYEVEFKSSIVAQRCYDFAAAMLAERERRGK